MPLTLASAPARIKLIKAVLADNPDVAVGVLQATAARDFAMDLNLVSSEQGDSLLIWAAANGYVDVIKHMLAAPTNEYVVPLNLDLATTIGNTALMIAARNGRYNIVAMLTAGLYGADVNLANKDGRTALILAALAGHCPVVNVLLLTPDNDNINGPAGSCAVDLNLADVTGAGRNPP